MNIKAQVVRFEQTGGPEVLRTETIELPDPAPGEVRIRHTAIGLNFADIYLRTGRYPAQGKLPSGLGNEGAGVVERVGPGVTGFKEGDRVCYFGGSPGSYSTHRNMGTERLIHTPPGISDEVAAAALLKGMTVEYLLNRCYRLQPGQDALFHAASGGVGLIAGQWGQHLGARMIGVAG
ncbi:MAG TPA: alcohol dehydrogenase catalytic domain-containing protein, partial [Phenylobacterium sp.]|nr:alcohol dehydrogenase catalytic domain-containing protein [Phenylobacterium sp.]